MWGQPLPPALSEVEGAVRGRSEAPQMGGGELGGLMSELGSQKYEPKAESRKPYFSLATTNSGAQSSARLTSESGKVQIDLRADSAY